jgi:hypothetical protein
MFNRYGNIPTIPQEIRDAQYKYFETIKPYLDKMSIVEVRAFQYYTDISLEYSTYILTRQMIARKNKQDIP